jgi:CHAT domain-containing protein/Tfp pilus assembly protein PilF
LSNLAAVYDKEGKLSAAEPLFKDALAMRKRLFKSDHPDIAASLNGLAHLYRAQGKLRDAEPLYADALAMNKRLFTGDNVRVAPSMNNLASVYKELGKLAEAEPLNIEALAMYRRLFKGDHPDTAQSLNNLARTYQDQAKLVAAEPLFKEALAMRQRLFNGDHPDVAESLNNLGGLYDDQGKPAAAESYYRKALGMYTRLFNGDHPDVATALSNLAAVCKSQGKLSDAEPLFKDALAMRQRLFEGDHPDVVLSMSNLAGLYSDQGKLAKAETLDKDALVMMQRLFNGDHPNVAHCMQSLAASYWTLGKLAEAELVCKDTLAMRKRLMVAYAKQKSEGEALTLLSSQSLSRDGLLSIARLRSVELGAAYDSAASYAAVWSTKGMIARVYEEHQHRARAVSTDPALAKMLDELVDARRRRADLLLGMPTKDPATLKQRADDLKAHDDSIAKLNVDLFRQLPIAARPAKLDAATFADLQKSLPADAAVIDFVRYDFFQFDNTQPIGEKKKRIELYLAFVATKANVTWVDLDTAATIESAIAAWRQAIASGQEIPANLPAKVRELVWAKVRKNIPDGTRVVYIAPDMGLCSVPWAALPGDKPGTVLLEDFAIATIPHAQFLLDKLWDQEAVKNSPTAALVVGGVKYDAQVTDSKVGSPGNLPAGDLAPWVDLKYAAAEADSLAKSAREHKLQVRQLEGEQATGAALLSELPKARTAHIATHGFFADPSFRSAFQLDPKEFAMTRRGERIGRAALSPLLMTGLVLAGANRPETPGRGIVTGESLIDLDLSGLELAVLSACETGLGEVAGGEGVFGLQRAFHMAGTRDVIASLWKVNDAATAALMGEFYKALWDDKLEPVFALQKAQLAVYRADPKKFRELARRGPGWGDKDFDPDKLHINADGKNSPVLWAAFTLSGPGRLNPPASGQRTADDSEQKTTTSSASTESHAASEDESPAPRQQMLLAHWILVAFLGTAALFVLVVVLAVVAWRLLARRSRG